jgi:hypothetical protein
MFAQIGTVEPTVGNCEKVAACLRGRYNGSEIRLKKMPVGGYEVSSTALSEMQVTSLLGPQDQTTCNTRLVSQIFPDFFLSVSSANFMKKNLAHQ